MKEKRNEFLSDNSDYLDIIQQAVAARNPKVLVRPSASNVVSALLNAEIAAKKQRLNYKFGNLSGQWRLYFATGTKKAQQRAGIVLGKGFYLPKFVFADINFEPNHQTENIGVITNQIEIAGFRLKLTGLCKYLEKKNLLAFDFEQVEISCLNRIIYKGKIRKKGNSPNFAQQPIAKLPFFAFFLVAEDFIAARGRGGGLAIWVK
ncbi:hypothetical protein [Calothrix sp. NIES-3974]|uniref:hypothetical protein n=1 Tax=Calothrix sp. NIES-3974 TaxID=2005462 RepID=UPI000B5E585C|nr:hypothetical protein [Calothrix sp. NIES-3974]BAZ03977.1 hypothetical protein NIES3974_06070 [Calothrix sp. NIES-3974]